MSYKVILFEDNETMRHGLAGMFALNPDYELCASFENADIADKAILVHRPDIVLTDIEMPGTNGILGIQKIRKVAADIKIIVLTVFEDNQNIFDAICAGANGYLLKKHAGTKLFAAMTEVMQGGAPMSASIAAKVLRMLAQPKHNVHNAYNLTLREKEILASLVQGNSYKMIAAAINLSIETVKTHIKNIYEKLQVHSQSEAVSKAIRQKII